MCTVHYLGDDSWAIILDDRNRVNIRSVMTRSGFNEYRSQVVFSTLSSTEDSGKYTCIVSIIPRTGYEYVTASDTNNMEVTFTVTGKCINLILHNDSSIKMLIRD